MQKHELPELSNRLTQLADALGGRAPSPAGMLVWLDALAECSMPTVLGVLTDWPKGHAKMPVPADVLRLARERLSERIERTSAEHARANRVAWSVERLRGDPDSPGYQAFVAAMRARRRQPHPEPRAWAERLREREQAGERLDYQQRRLWREALGVSTGVSTGVAESDDEREARIEREAIMAESAGQGPQA